VLENEYVIDNEIKAPKVLLVTRDASVLRLVELIATSGDWQLESTGNAWQALEQVQSGPGPDLLLLSLSSAERDSLHILRWFLGVRPALPVIVLDHLDDGERKQESVRLGVLAYMVMPDDARRLGALIQQHLSVTFGIHETTLVSDDVELIAAGNFFIGICPMMRKLRAQAAMLARADMPVLILGEAGSGKETTARLVHALSVRSGFKFAKVNCAALPGDLLEKELFGCGPDRANKNAPVVSGKLESCANGTILLDEITEMPLWLQTVLMQVIQNKTLIRRGASTPRSVDVRILAASTTSLEHAISRNKLREDLYARLSAYPICVPPLRERNQEILLLARHFMHQLAKHYGMAPREFSAATVKALEAYSWPGNLRELETVVKRYLMLGDSESVLHKVHSNSGEADYFSIQDASQNLDRPTPSLLRSPAGKSGTDSLRSLVKSAKLETERNAIGAALEKTSWNRKAAAQLLKISYRTLLYKIEQYQLRSPDALMFPGGNGHKGKGIGL
jgi:two-component system, NtrC family, response regulator AtoC